MNTDKYRWYDYSFLLQAIQDWIEHSSDMHKEHGCSVSSHKTVKQMRIAVALIKRVRSDEIYYEQNKVFGRSRHRDCEAQRRKDINYLFDFMKKNITGWWD